MNVDWNSITYEGHKLICYLYTELLPAEASISSKVPNVTSQISAVTMTALRAGEVRAGGINEIWRDPRVLTTTL
jgi:hypothetical protein